MKRKWMPISEMAEQEPEPVIIGQWIRGEWANFATQYRSAAEAGRWTHLFRPFIPAPPKNGGPA